MFQRILIVCTGNICRSPLAAGLLKAQRAELDVTSAGTRAPVGLPADPHAVACAHERGADLARHRSRHLDAESLAGRDLVLTAERCHLEDVLAAFPASRGRVYRLGHWRDVDIPDPIGCDRDVFEETAQVIEACVADWLPHLAMGVQRNASV